MDKNHILENGILEQYLLDELSIKQRVEVEHILNSDSELQSNFDKLEASFEFLGMDNAITPPENVKLRLMKSVNSSTKIIPIKHNKSKFYIGIAASIAIILGCTSFWMFNQLKSVKEELKIVQEEKALLKDDLKNLGVEIAKTSNWVNIINNSNTEKYILVGNDLAPNAKVISYVNHQDKTIAVNAQNLPKLDENHDYQLWADVEGEMISMGVLDRTKNLLTMNYIDNAESLNITIEPLGGNDHPTVSRLVSNVYLQP